ncbi:hypothetical protein V8G54_031445 [Vigna mungo]|uniref:Retrotransposon gag domain-containing protein n=1 Tax=Vigna mungo TaxID=3915 RepID=A0AAQ3MJP2_VIGMU
MGVEGFSEPCEGGYAPSLCAYPFLSNNTWGYRIESLPESGELPFHSREPAVSRNCLIAALPESCGGKPMAVDRMKAQIRAVRSNYATIRQNYAKIHQDLQEIIRMLGDRGHNQNEQPCDQREEEEGERGEERHAVQPNGKKRVELPTFEGFDPFGWVSKAEKLFELHGVAEKERVRLTEFSMEGSAHYWFKAWKAKAKNPSWEGFKGAMVWRFGERNRGTTVEGVAANKQSGTREEYAPTSTVKELQESIRNRVRLLDSRDLMVAMSIVRDGEELHGGAKTGGGGMRRNLTNWSRSSGVVWVEPRRQTQNRTGPAESSGSMPKEVIQVSEVTKTNFDNRGRRAIVSSHQCPERSLKMMMMAEDEEEDGIEAETELAQMQRELSAFSAGGLTQPKRMKLQGEIEGKRALIWIDSVASHKFGLLFRPLPKPPNLKLQVSIEAIENHMPQVMVIDEIGTKHEAMATSTIVQSGIQLICKIVRTNWGNMTMEYSMGDKKICIKGNPNMPRQLVKPRSLPKLMEAESWATGWNLSLVEAGDSGEWGADLTEVQRIELNAVLQKHYPLFRDLHGLPLPHNKEHRIQPKERVDPINGRPCQYQYPMKGEIERQIEGLLKAGINRPDERQLGLATKVSACVRRFIKRRIGKNKTAPPPTPFPTLRTRLFGRGV